MTKLTKEYGIIATSQQDIVINMFARLYKKPCSLLVLTGFEGEMKAWEFCSEVFNEENIQLIGATYGDFGFGEYEDVTDDVETDDDDTIVTKYRKYSNLLNITESAVSRCDDNDADVMKPVEIFIALKYHGILIRFWEDGVKIAWEENTTNQNLVNAFITYLREKTETPEPEKECKQSPEIQIVSRTSHGEFYTSRLTLPYNPITPNMLRDSYQIKMGESVVDGNTFMEEICERLNEVTVINNRDIYPGKGLYIVNGEPGTGKSQFLTELLLILNQTNREVFYFPPDCISLLGKPEFVPWLMKHPGSIIIAEDAEVVLQASESRSAATSNILNLSEGILGSALQLTFIATFNCDIKDIDRALLRTGRLQLAGEFMRIPYTYLGDAATTIAKEKYKRTFAPEEENMFVHSVYERVNDKTEGGKLGTMSLAELYEILFAMNDVQN